MKSNWFTNTGMKPETRERKRREEAEAQRQADIFTQWLLEQICKANEKKRLKRDRNLKVPPR